MKKNKQYKKGGVTTEAKSGASSNSSFVQIALACILVIFVVGGVYGYECVSRKICGNGVVAYLAKNTTTIVFPKGVIHAEVVDTEESRELGLSGRTGLAKDAGMLFVFDKPGRYGFWMKDMLFSLDMVWINDDGLVVHVERHVTPDSYPKAFINTLEARYVIELPDGAADTYGIYMGVPVTIKK